MSIEEQQDTLECRATSNKTNEANPTMDATLTENHEVNNLGIDDDDETYDND